MKTRRFTKHVGLSVAVLLVVGVSAACSPEPAKPPEVVETKTPAVTTTPAETDPAPAPGGMTWSDGAPVELTDLAASTALASTKSDIKETEKLLVEWEGEQIFPMALGPDNQVLVTIAPAENFDSATDGLKKHERFGLLQGKDVKVFTTAKEGSAPRQALFGTIAEGHAVWVETPSIQAGIDDWQIWAQDLASTGDPALLYESKDPALGTSDFSLSEDSGITISGDRVYWAMQTGPTDGGSNTSIVSVPLTGADGAIVIGSGARTENDSGSLPTVVTDQVAFMSLAGDVATGVSLIEDPQVHSDFIMFGGAEDGDLDVRQIAGGEKLLAVSAPNDVYVFNIRDKAAIKISGSPVQGLAVCNNRVTWTDREGDGGFGGHQYVFNVGTSDLIKVDTPSNVGVGICSGNSILWAAADGKGATITKW